MNFICHILGPEVGIPEQHSWIPMARYLIDRIDGKSKVPLLTGDLQNVPDQDKVILAGTYAILDTSITKQG